MRGVTFNGKHSYWDWGLLLKGFPVVSPPEPKTKLVEVPGSDTVIDLTQALTGQVHYKQREIKCYFTLPCHRDRWETVYTEILNHLHGKAIEIILDDDNEYSYTGRWTKPFAAHDLGQYPKANGQVYGGDMPLEEAGNMITLAATICMLEGNTSYVEKYFDIMTTWTDYLVENGLHPANQLCTDDFAGHWAGNCNLAIKAIMGIAGYAEIAKMMGKDDVYEKYNAKAKEMAAAWEKETKVKDHYELAYGAGSKTWSQKYNMIWDKLWKTNIIPNNAMQTEVKYYLKKQNKYGLPLDSRDTYTKGDWVMWTATMADDDEFPLFIKPMWNFMNETTDRIPLTDFYYTDKPQHVQFRCRSVVGGFFMKMLDERLND